jgi:hypothetical protein
MMALTLVSRLALVLLNIPINLAHDPLSPLDARIDKLVRARAPLRPFEKIVRCLHVMAGKNRCHDSDDSFPSLIHLGGHRTEPHAKIARG